jgi:hypothetical protein
VIHRNFSEDCLDWATRRDLIDKLGETVRAERHPEPAHQALAGTSSQGVTHHSDNLIGSLGLSCVKGANI